MKKQYIKLFLIVTFSFIQSSPGDASAVFLLIAPGASAVGVGEAQVAKADDAYATYYNPAGLAFQTGTEYAGMHVNWLPGLADDIYYEFAAFKQHIPWLGTIGGNVIFLNLGEQQGTDELGHSTGNFRSYMYALTASYGAKINESSGWGANFKIIHQKLADHATASETGTGKPYSTDFAFDVGYLKKFGKAKKNNEAKNLFNELTSIYIKQKSLNEEIYLLEDIDRLIVEQKALKLRLEDLSAKFLELGDHSKFIKLQAITFDYNAFVKLQEGLPAAIEDIEAILLELDAVNNNSENKEKITENLKFTADRLLFDLLEVESSKKDFADKVDIDDKFNLAFAISNIGPEVDFIDKQQADPLPTNIKMGLFATLYQDESKRLNLLFDANKMLVARYEAMDWDGDGIIDGSNDANVSHKEEGFFDPWYKAIVTSWLDDWYLGGDRNIPNEGDEDINADGNIMIGGYSYFEIDGVPGPTIDSEIVASLEIDNNEDGIFDEGDEFFDFNDPNYGIYNSDGIKEKGTGDERKFSDELKDMVYSLGLEFWYTDNFALRLGYLYDEEGNLKHPTLGAGVRFGQYGFDLGYILGDEGEPRSNTLLFSMNMALN